MMKNKTTHISFFGGIILFILIFPCQIFFLIYPRGMNLNQIYVHDGIFLIVYCVIFYTWIAKRALRTRVILYIVIPFVISSTLSISSSVYYNIRYGSRIIFDFLFLFYYYFGTGFWSVGLFNCLIDLKITSNGLQNEKSSTANKKDD